MLITKKLSKLSDFVIANGNVCVVINLSAALTTIWEAAVRLPSELAKNPEKLGKCDELEGGFRAETCA